MIRRCMWPFPLMRQQNRYEGAMYDERFASLESGLTEGQHHIEFTVTYANGTVKSQDMPIRIIGHVLETAGVHRRR